MPLKVHLTRVPRPECFEDQLRTLCGRITWPRERALRSRRRLTRAVTCRQCRSCRIRGRG